MKNFTNFKKLSLALLLWCAVSLACQLGVVKTTQVGVPTDMPMVQNTDPTTENTQPPTPTVKAAAPTSQCLANQFLDVSTYKPKSGWPAPKLKVACNVDAMTIETNGVPNFAIAIKQSDNTFSITLPLNPQKASQPIDFRGGLVGVAVNGVQIWAPLESPQDGFADPVREGLIEICGGHAVPFHFHANPTCLFPSQENQTSLVLGYALDGFSILAPYMCEDAACAKIRKVKSSWQFSGANSRNVWDFYKYVEGSGDLDKCNGMIGPDGVYHYYATDTFPYFIACYSGTPVVPTGNTGMPPNGGGQPDGGNPPPNKP